MAVILPPNTELVATTYLRNITQTMEPAPGVGTTLPEDTTSWADGFVQIVVVGGSPDVYVPVRQPLIQVDVWVPTKGTKPRWSFANSIAEYILGFLYDTENTQMLLSLGNYKDALVQVAYPVSEPRRVSNDPAGYARYTFDVALTWTTP